MTYEKFLERVINDGIEAAKSDYANDKMKRQGSVAGFEACRGKTPAQLAELLAQAREATHLACLKRVEGYWRVRCYEAEVEWVCNCVSAMAMNEGLETIIPPTARGVMKVAEIVGVR